MVNIISLLSEGNKVCIQMSFRMTKNEGLEGKSTNAARHPPLPMPTTLLAALLVVYSMAIVSVSSWIRHTYARPLSSNFYKQNA